ncbi:AAA family ATPase [bacterium]|nr:AAA family ATPase [bacterium]
MLKEELIKRSPVRVLEKSIHGGLGSGNLGVITARKGVGKTACLAHLAIDKMMRGQNVLHISFTDDPHHVENWYRQLFDELTRHYQLENAYDVFEEIKCHRLIINFKTEVTFDHIRKMIREIEGGSDFIPDIIIVDGRDFENLSVEILSGWKEFSKNQNAAIWFAAVLHRENLQCNDRGIPSPVNRFEDLFSVIIMLEPVHDYIDMKLLKDHDSKNLEKLRLKLDFHTMLISNHRI